MAEIEVVGLYDTYQEGIKIGGLNSYQCREKGTSVFYQKHSKSLRNFSAFRREKQLTKDYCSFFLLALIKSSLVLQKKEKQNNLLQRLLGNPLTLKLPLAHVC